MFLVVLLASMLGLPALTLGLYAMGLSDAMVVTIVGGVCALPFFAGAFIVGSSVSDRARYGSGASL